MADPQKVLILGATGMLGHVLFNELSLRRDIDAYATVRRPEDAETFFEPRLRSHICAGIDAKRLDLLEKWVVEIEPRVIVNCIGVIDQQQIAAHPVSSMTANSILPHQVHQLCQRHDMRMVHIGTDALFDGRRGMYTEKDPVSVSLPYSMTKYMGEVAAPNGLTLRTSIIGHEIKHKRSLVEWFLAQRGTVQGYSKVMYSGLPTVELARVIADFVLPLDSLRGIYHLSSPPISKYELLKLIAEQYQLDIKIEPSPRIELDYTLDSEAFRTITGYVAPGWERLVENMHQHFLIHGGEDYYVQL